MWANTCYIEFRIKYRVITSDQCLAILGNVSCLGEWAPRRAVRAVPWVGDEWVVSMPTPKDSAFEWKWVVVGKEMKVVKWEERENRLSVIKNTGALFCVWNQADEPEVLHVQHHNLKISTTYTTHHGQSLSVVGSSAYLGSWESRTGLRAAETPPGSGLWVIEVVLDRYSQVEWKWVVVDSELTAVRWEERENRVICPRDDRGQVFAPWNGEETVDTTDVPSVVSFVMGLFKNISQTSRQDEGRAKNIPDKTDVTLSKNIIAPTLSSSKPSSSSPDQNITEQRHASTTLVHGQETSDREYSAALCPSSRGYVRSLDNHNESRLTRVMGVVYDVAVLPFRAGSDLVSSVVDVFSQLVQHVAHIARVRDVLGLRH